MLRKNCQTQPVVVWAGGLPGATRARWGRAGKRGDPGIFVRSAKKSIGRVWISKSGALRDATRGGSGKRTGGPISRPFVWDRAVARISRRVAPMGRRHRPQRAEAEARLCPDLRPVRQVQQPPGRCRPRDQGSRCRLRCAQKSPSA